MVQKAIFISDESGITNPVDEIYWCEIEVEDDDEDDFDELNARINNGEGKIYEITRGKLINLR
jgi:hypothetical protein